MGKKSRAKAEPKPIKLDLGCGPNPKEGFIGVDALPFDGKVKIVTDLRKRWPWKDNSVDEAYTSHFVEHLEAWERVHFIKELYRVLKPEAKCQMIVPHWASCRAYGDLTHKWPPVSEFWFYYLSKEWRKTNAPHSQYGSDVDFQATWGYTLHQDLMARNQEFQQDAITWKKEAVQDVVATLVRK